MTYRKLALIVRKLSGEPPKWPQTREPRSLQSFSRAHFHPHRGHRSREADKTTSRDENRHIIESTPMLNKLLPTLLLCSAAFAQTAGIDIPYKKFVLDNGLTVIVHEDHKAPSWPSTSGTTSGRRTRSPARPASRTSSSTSCSAAVRTFTAATSMPWSAWAICSDRSIKRRSTCSAASSRTKSARARISLTASPSNSSPRTLILPPILTPGP